MNRQRIGDVAETLLNYFEHNKTFQTDKLMAVPAACYTDPDEQRAEVDLIFKRVPLRLALSCEIPKPGDYKAMEAVGLPILIARDSMGTVRTFFNVCAHRWSPVAAEGYGNCSRFICPFHGWTYGVDGKLMGITDRAKFGDIDRSAHGLKELPCEERHGMIFVCLTPGALLDLDGYYGGLLDEFADAGLKDWALLGSRTLEGANWKIVLTNFLETYHFATLHSKTVARDFVSNVAHYEGFGPNMRFGFLQHGIANLRAVPREQWGEQESRGGFNFTRYFFPNATAALLPSRAVFTQLFPGPTPDRCRILVLFLRKERPKDEADRKQVEEEIERSMDVVRDEDLALGFRIQKGLASGAYESLLHGRNESGNQYFHKWVNWYLQGDPLLPKPVLE